MQQEEQGRGALGEPDLINVTVTHHEEIFADRADLYVTIRGSSLVTGTAALTKAQEVGQLVTALTDYGLKPSDILLQDVYAEVSTGFLGKSSSASYHLKVHCTDLDKLVDILSIITSQKNTKLDHIDWGYSTDSDLEESGLRDRWLDACILRANAKAARIATTLGVSLVGIRRFTDSYLGGKDVYQPDYGPPGMARYGTKASAGGGPGMAVSHSKWVTFNVVVAYRISGLMTDTSVNFTAAKQLP
jgi:uncharacterized protein YggE